MTEEARTFINRGKSPEKERTLALWGCQSLPCRTLPAALGANEQTSFSLLNREEETGDQRKSDCLIARNLISCPELSWQSGQRGSADFNAYWHSVLDKFTMRQLPWCIFKAKSTTCPSVILRGPVLQCLLRPACPRGTA